MFYTYIYIAAVIGVIIIVLRIFRKPIIKYMQKLSYQLRIRTLRKAIQEADKRKNETGRKGIVVFNTTTKEYEAVDKRLLKDAANATKGKTNRYLNHNRVKQIQKHSLYVTK